MADESRRWQGSEYQTVVSEKNGQVTWKVIRREKDGTISVPAKGKAESKAEARFLAEHRKGIIREGDSIH